MGIRRTLLRPLAFLAGAHADRQVRAWLAAHERTAEEQETLLGDLIARHAGTAFGRDHGFDRIGSYAAFARRVPVRDYEHMRPYMDRVFAGESTALLPPGEAVCMFSRTSGTTGSPKHIPITRQYLADLRRGWNVFGVKALRDHPHAWLRGILQITSPLRETDSPAGLPCGAVSGLLAATQKRIVRRMYPVPRGVYGIADAETRYYTALRCSVHRDVGVVTTPNPSTTIKLVETGQTHAERLIRDVADGTCTPPGDGDPSACGRLRLRRRPVLAQRMAEGLRRDGRLLPEHFWNVALLLNWTGGTLGLYLPRLRELFPGVPIRDIGLLASEGRFSIPLADETPAGVAEITGNFLEFIPADERDAAQPTVLRAGDVRVGQEYFLVVTNRAGLWRYDIDDRVRVTDFLGGSPVFAFLSRGRSTASITGEKITEHQVVEAMAQATADMGVRVERFELQGCFPSGAVPHYELRLERLDGLDEADLAGRMDRALAALNVEYASKRSSGRLAAIRPRLLPPETLLRKDQQLSRKGRSEQFKRRYLIREVAADDGDGT
ncbi:MAG: GH3 auxin-responsive promoter family protein [Phycisphaerae bacterium]|nr:GH3 auxin-responsive promoter family protein [Phycisphaerae bacterium]